MLPKLIRLSLNSMKSNFFTAAVFSALISFLSFPPKVLADINIYMEEKGNSVVFSYSGFLSKSNLEAVSTKTFPSTPRGTVYAAGSKIEFSPRRGGPVNGMDYYYGSMTGGPLSIGTGSYHYPTSATGNVFSVETDATGNVFTVENSRIGIPSWYADGTPISGSMTFSGATFIRMGLDAFNGPYTWTLSNGQLVTLTAGPSPASVMKELEAEIEKVKKELKRAKRSGQQSKIKKLKRSRKKLKSELNAL